MSLEVIKKYAKFVPMVLATVAAALVGLIHPGMTPADWSHVVIIGAGALSVLVAPNVPGAKYVKETLAAITAVATVLVTGFTGFDANSILQIIVAIGGAFGVASVKNIGDYYHFATSLFTANRALAISAGRPVVAESTVEVPEGPADLPVAPAVPVENAPASEVVTPAETSAPPAEVSTAPTAPTDGTAK